ncbi:MAG: hypothetical protein ABI183_02365 [Polyangiaceae bacterium]
MIANQTGPFEGGPRLRIDPWAAIAGPISKVIFFVALGSAALSASAFAHQSRGGSMLALTALALTAAATLLHLARFERNPNAPRNFRSLIIEDGASPNKITFRGVAGMPNLEVGFRLWLGSAGVFGTFCFLLLTVAFLRDAQWRDSLGCLVGVVASVFAAYRGIGGLVIRNAVAIDGVTVRLFPPPGTVVDARVIVGAEQFRLEARTTTLRDHGPVGQTLVKFTAWELQVVAHGRAFAVGQYFPHEQADVANELVAHLNAKLTRSPLG